MHFLFHTVLHLLNKALSLELRSGNHPLLIYQLTYTWLAVYMSIVVNNRCHLCGTSWKWKAILACHQLVLCWHYTSPGIKATTQTGRSKDLFSMQPWLSWITYSHKTVGRRQRENLAWCNQQVSCCADLWRRRWPRTPPVSLSFQLACFEQRGAAESHVAWQHSL